MSQKCWVEKKRPTPGHAFKGYSSRLIPHDRHLKLRIGVILLFLALASDIAELVDDQELPQVRLQADRFPIAGWLHRPHLLLLHRLPIRIYLVAKSLLRHVHFAENSKFYICSNVSVGFLLPGIDQPNCPAGFVRKAKSLHLCHPPPSPGVFCQQIKLECYVKGGL